MCRTTLIFSPACSPGFGECLTYLERTSKMFSRSCTGQQSQTMLKKSVKSQKIRDSENQLACDDIPGFNYGKSEFFGKIVKLKKLPDFFSKFHRWFKNVLQHLRQLFRTHHPWEKSLETIFETFEKKVFRFLVIFGLFSTIKFFEIGISQQVLTKCWPNFFPMSETRSSFSVSNILSISQKLKILDRKANPPLKMTVFRGGSAAQQELFSGMSPNEKKKRFSVFCDI